MDPGWIEEIIESARKGLLSNEQVQITLDRIQFPKQATYEALLKKYGIKSDRSLIRCFVRTVTGRWWSRFCRGGTDFYLSELDRDLFKKMITDREEDLNCCTTSHAYDLAFSLRQRRNQIGQKLLLVMQLPLLTLHLNDVLYPSQSWLKQYCSSINVKICRSQQIEIA
jgi:hypothetical protein